MLIHVLSDVLRKPELSSEFAKDPAGFLKKRYPELSDSKRELLITRNLAGVHTALQKEVTENLAGGAPTTSYTGPDITFSLDPKEGASGQALTLNLTATARVGSLPPLATWTITFQCGGTVAPVSVVNTSGDSHQAVLTLQTTFPEPGEYLLSLVSPDPSKAPIVINNEFDAS
jgi:hypothetical protein